jgi:alpha-galactosidase
MTICEVSYTIRSEWYQGFVADITIKNTGSTTIDGWTLDWTFPNGQTINYAWSGELLSPGPNASIRNATWNGTLAPGESTSDYGGDVGFIGSYTGTNGEPTSFTLNGQPCTVK